MASGRAIQALLHSAVPAYRDLIAQHAFLCDWETQGLLFAYRDRRAFEAYGSTDRLLSDSFHEPARRLVGEEMREFEPALNPGLAGGWYYETDAHLRADRLLAAWRVLLESRGVLIREGCTFDGFARGAAGASAAGTSQGRLEAEAFVVATGAWTPLLSRELGCRVPIQPGKGYSLTTSRPARCPRVPLIFPETRVAVTPLASGLRLGSMMEFVGYDSTMSPKRLDLLRSGAAPFLAEPWGDKVEESWTGWRPMTYDGIPIIGPSPALPNVLIAAGHGMLGVTMAPATGRLVAEMLNGATPHIDPAPAPGCAF